MKEAATYNELLESSEWKTRREEILKRDGHQCLGCGSTSSLHVHHRQYQQIEGEFIKPWEYAGKYLVTLCSDCHRLGHSLFKVSTFQITKSVGYELV